MAVVAGTVGGLIGFGLGLVLTEVIIGNPPDQTGFDWVFMVDFVFAVVGVLVGVEVARRRRARLPTD